MRNFGNIYIFRSRIRKDLLSVGIEASKKFLTCMFSHVQTALDMKQVISAGPFLYFVLQEVRFVLLSNCLRTFWKRLNARIHLFLFQGTLNAKYYSNPDCLWMLATFALRAYVASSRKSKSTRLPLIASAPLEEGYCLVVGVPPVAETAPRRWELGIRVFRLPISFSVNVILIIQLWCVYVASSEKRSNKLRRKLVARWR